jgi:hypothetical protein
MAAPYEGREQGKSLKHVRAAQLRAKAVRWAIGKSVLGSVFLVGALSYALGPTPKESSSVSWMALLVVMSTFHVGLGLRTFAKANRKLARYWLPATLAWGALSVALLKILLDR